MPAFLHNKYIRYGLFGFGALVLLSLFLTILSALSTGLSGPFGKVSNELSIAPSSGTSMDTAMNYQARMVADSYGEAAMIAPYPHPSSGYTSGLEQYETTDYDLTAHTRQFDELCQLLVTLKADPAIHFKSLSSSVNHCTATFFVPDAQVPAVLAQFSAFKNVDSSRSTQSVTRHKQVIEEQSSIIGKQLASVDATLTEAETAYDELIAFARANNDATALGNAIDQKLRQIENLTQRKISLNAQLDSYAQQAADLEERIGMVAVAASFSRSNPIDQDRTERRWEGAWRDLKDQFTTTQIGLTAGLGIFLFNVVQFGLYVVIVIILVRFGWKFVQKIWRW